MLIYAHFIHENSHSVANVVHKLALNGGVTRLSHYFCDVHHLLISRAGGRADLFNFSTILLYENDLVLHINSVFRLSWLDVVSE